MSFLHDSAAARRSSKHATNPRSNFVAHRHALTRISQACRVNSRSITFHCVARREKHISVGNHGSNRQFARISATQYASELIATSRITGITQQLWAERTVTQTVGSGTATTSTIVTELYPAPFAWTAGYDSRGRLTSFNRAGSEQSYSYDPNSNRLTSIAKKVSDTDIDGIFEATDRAATTSQALRIDQSSNKLLGFNQSVLTQATAANGTRRTVSNVVTAVNYQLDANGNLTSDGLRTFEYNAENRLDKVQITQNGEAAKITYLHNAAGQRSFKSEPQTAQTLPNETQLGTGFVNWLKSNFQWLYATAQTNATLGTSYSYGEASIPSWAMTGEYGNGGANSTGRTEYIWLPTDDGAAIPVGMLRGNRFYNIHSDHLGTPRLMTDDTAKPTWQWGYSAFGDNKPTGVLKVTTNPNSAITNTPTLLNATNPAVVFNARMPGQYFDQETGHFYNYFRSYDPKTGRYPQADPSGLAGGSNRFGYADGNAISKTDPMGLWALWIHHNLTTSGAAGTGLGSGQVAELADLVVAADKGTQGIADAHRHGMCSAYRGHTPSPEECKRRYDDFVKAELAKCTLTGLANAIHATQDTFAGGHKDFPPYRGMPVSPLHIMDDMAPDRLQRHLAVTATRQMINAWQSKCNCSTTK